MSSERSRHGGVDEIPLPVGPGRLWLCGKHYVGPDPDSAMAAIGATTVVCLSETHEFADRYPAYIAWLGDNAPGRALWYPIPDFHAPDEPEARELIDELLRRISAGETLLVHCGGGIGRSGTVAAALLITVGVPLEEAVTRVRAHRPMAGPEAGTQTQLLRLLDDRRSALTASLDAAFAGLERDGFALVHDALSAEEVRRLRSRLVEVACAEREAGIDRDPAWEDGPRNQRVFGLLNKGVEFVELAAHPVAEALMGHLLDPAYLLSSITANITGPGGHPMYLHYDQDYVPQPWPAVPLVANIIWMLDGFTEHNGATRFIPGSHHEDHTGWSPESIAARAGETVAVGGPAGSLVCLDGRVLHQTGANTTADELRYGIIAYYCQPWIRQQENASLSILPEVWPGLPPRVRELVGLKKYRGLGCVSGPTQRGFRY